MRGLKNLCWIFLKGWIRNSHRRCSIKRDVLKKFTKFIGKHQCHSLFFNKVAALRPATLLKKRLWQRYFLLNFAKLLKTPVLQNTSGGCYCCIILTPLIVRVFVESRQVRHLNNAFTVCDVFR